MCPSNSVPFSSVPFRSVPFRLLPQNTILPPAPQPYFLHSALSQGSTRLLDPHHLRFLAPLIRDAPYLLPPPLHSGTQARGLGGDRLLGCAANDLEDAHRAQRAQVARDDRVHVAADQLQVRERIYSRRKLVRFLHGRKWGVSGCQAEA